MLNLVSVHQMDGNVIQSFSFPIQFFSIPFFLREYLEILGQIDYSYLTRQCISTTMIR